MSGDNMNTQKLINDMSVRQEALKQLIDRDITGNTLAVLEAWREVKFWREAILRGEYNDSPLQKKEELLKKFREKECPDKLITIDDLDLDIHPSTFEYFRNGEDYE